MAASVCELLKNNFAAAAAGGTSYAIFQASRWQSSPGSVKCCFLLVEKWLLLLLLSYLLGVRVMIRYQHVCVCVRFILMDELKDRR